MSFSELIKKKPLVLVFALLIFIGVLILLITPQNLQFIVPVLSYSILGLALVFSAVATYMTYKKYERPYDVLIIPLFVSIVFICLTAILMLLCFLLDSNSITKLTSELNTVSFPLALFGVGISLYYFVEVQFSSDKKLDLILNKIKKPQYIDKESSPSEQKRVDVSPEIKDEPTISEEGKLIMQHLFARHQTSLSSGDAIDLKLAQMIALNGLILSFILRE